MTALLELRDVHARYGPVKALHGVSLAVGEGEIVAVLGANGAGKTTTLRALSGMLPLMAGDVCLDGKSQKGRAPDAIARGGVVHIPQGRGIFPNLKVDETLRLACAIAGVRRAETDARVADMYAVFERLYERRTQLAGTLSGGEQQMLAIGRALLTNPRLLILDEATEGLAPLIRAEIYRSIETLKQAGVSILVIDKDVRALTRVADRHYVLEKGHVVWSGASRELAADASVQHRYLGV